MSNVNIIKKYNTGFTQVPNWVLNATDISLKAKGLYAYLFSKPDGWQFYFSVITNDIKESRGQFLSVMKELVDNGYITRTQFNENGKFGGMIYEFVDKDHIRKEPYTEKSVYGKTDTHNNIDNINNTDIINNIEREIEKEPTPASPAKLAFTPPTYKEMIDYAHLMDDTAGVGGFRCTREMADEFWAYYTANGWVNSNQFRTPILDWKAKFRQWVVREKKNSKDEYIEAPITVNE